MARLFQRKTQETESAEPAGFSEFVMSQLPGLEKKALAKRNAPVQLFTPEFQRRYGVRGLKVEGEGNRGHLDKLTISLSDGIYDYRGLDKKLEEIRDEPPEKSRFEAIENLRKRNFVKAFQSLSPVQTQKRVIDGIAYGEAILSKSHLKIGGKGYYLANSAQNTLDLYDPHAKPLPFELSKLMDKGKFTKAPNPSKVRARLIHVTDPQSEFQTVFTLHRPLENPKETLALLKLFFEGRHAKLD